MNSGDYKITFGKNIYTIGQYYGEYILWKKKNSTLIVNENTYKKLMNYETIKATYTVGHGAHLRVEYDHTCIKKITQLIEQQVYP